jgi:hypothetical protein
MTSELDMGPEDTAYRARSMVDGPVRDARPDRPDDRYEVAARIHSASGRRGRLVAGVAVVAVALIVGLGVIGRSGPGPRPSHAAVVAGPRPTATAPTDVALPPDAEIARSDPQLASVPVMLNGLGWLDLEAATLTPAPVHADGEWHFQRPGGAVVCVCIDRSVGVRGPTLRLIGFNPDASVDWERSIADWMPALPFTVADAAMDPATGDLIVASLVPTTFTNGTGSDWYLRIQRLGEGSGGPIQEARLDGIDVAALGSPATLQLQLRVAPDGRAMRVTLQQLAEDLSVVPGSRRSWTIGSDGVRFQGFGADAADAKDLGPDGCASEGGALISDGAFVELCRSPDVDPLGRQEVFLRIRTGGGEDRVSVGSVDVGDVLGWQVDGTRHLVYVWAAMAHLIARYDLASGELHFRVMASPGADLVALRSVAADGPVPPASRRAVIWQSTEPAWAAVANPLAGSTDGRLLYGAGFTFPTRPGTFSALDSTGIWAFDADSLALVAHWPAVAAYDALGLIGDGRYLVAVGNPGGDELDLFGNHGRELAVIDTRDGSIVAIQRRLVLRLGGSPTVLPPGPPVPAAPPG